MVIMPGRPVKANGSDFQLGTLSRTTTRPPRMRQQLQPSCAVGLL